MSIPLHQLRAGVIGTGFIGPVHIEALKRLGVQVTAICGSTKSAQATADKWGIPKVYGDYDYTHWLVAPTPAGPYNFEVLYYERIQPLDSANQSNWFTQYAPQALLYGTLLQAMPFLKNDTRVQLWQTMYQQYMQTLKTEDIQRIADRQANALDT